jgi:hypothetical protein
MEEFELRGSENENREFRGIFGPERQEETGEGREQLMRRSGISLTYQILLRLSTEGLVCRVDMQHA